jgi:hypothetical protein
MPREGKGWMSANKRQQTMAKIRREQAVKERRALKQEKREAARRAKAGGSTSFEAPDGDRTEAADVQSGTTTADVEPVHDPTAPSAAT